MQEDPVPTAEAAAPTAPPPTDAPRASRSPWIIGPVRDVLFFIGSPLLALGFAGALDLWPLISEDAAWFGKSQRPVDLMLGTLIMAHLGLVLFRSHGNRDVFRRFPLRFTLAPVALFAAMLSSLWVSVTVSVLATFWDVYHSGLQTFGLGRIYDARAGNDPAAGRRLDVGLNHLLYAGPIIGGATLFDHLIDFQEYRAVGGPEWLTEVAYLTIYWKDQPTWWVLALGLPYLAWYLWSYRVLIQRGYAVSPQKIALYASTGLTSVLAWGLNSFGEAFLIMNLFHAVQYFALVWWVERGNITGRLGLAGRPWGRALALALFLGLAFGYGLWAELTTASNRPAWCAVMVIAIMHFWYDGFIWSVRKRQV